MDWEDLKQSIGDKAKEIIESDRGNGMSGGKVECFMTDHKSKPTLEWLADLYKFHCYNCSENYDIIDHCKWMAHDDMKQAYRILCELAGEEVGEYKEKPIVETKVEPVLEPIEVEFPLVYILSDTLYSKAGHYLTGRGISRDTLLAYKVTSTPEAIYFNYYVGDSPVKIKGRAIGDMDNGRDKYAYTPKGGTNTLYGQHLYTNQRTIAICEGEIDALSLHTALKANELDDVVLASSVPSGSSSMSWIENSRYFLDKFESIILVPDNDKAGEKFIEKAGSELIMVKPVRIADLKGTGGNDVNELLQKKGKKAVCGLIANSKQHIPDFTVDLSKLPEKPQESQYERSGFYVLDKITRGLRHGLITLFTGHTGAGKTTILRQMIIFNIQNRRRIGIMMGEETPVMFRDMVLRQAFIKSHIDLFEPEIDEWSNKDWSPKPDLIKLFNDTYHPYISHFNCGHLQDGQRLKKLYEWIKFEAHIHNTRLFIIDNLMKLEVGIGDSINSAQGDIIDTLKNIATGLNVHIILVAHPKKNQQTLNSESVSGSQKIANTVDNMITFQRFDKMDDATATKLIQRINKNNDYDEITAFMKVEKNRVWAKLGVVPMRYNPETNCIHDLANEGTIHYGWTLHGRKIEPENF